MGNVAIEPVGSIQVQPTTVVFHPERVGEMVECNERFNPVPAQQEQFRSVVVNRLIRKPARIRLDSGPLHTEPVGPHSQLDEKPGIIANPIPVIICVAR